MCLALAWLPETTIEEATFNPAGLSRELILLGLVGIIDLPREEAVEAVKQCHDGGIRVTMITGDHAVTAASIAKMLGIGDGKSYVTGSQIEDMDDDALEVEVPPHRRLCPHEPRAQAPPRARHAGERADRFHDGRRRE